MTASAEPVEPAPTRWHLTTDGADPPDALVGVGAVLAPGTILAAYRAGIFPMGVGPGGSGPIGWWSPDPRGVLLPDDLHVSRSLRRSLRSFEITTDTAFDEGLIKWLSEADLMIHETNYGVHTPYEKLAALPAELRARMRLIHYPDDFDTGASVIEPLAQGRRYTV